jgi:hypothetical protein
MTAHTVTPLRPLTDPPYTDTAALNDIHAILTLHPVLPGADLAAEVAEVLTRARRPLVAPRDIEISATETAQGWPVACTQAGDTAVFVRQDPASGRLLVEVTTKSADAARELTVTLDGAPLQPVAHPGLCPA